MNFFCSNVWATPWSTNFTLDQLESRREVAGDLFSALTFFVRFEGVRYEHARISSTAKAHNTCKRRTFKTSVGAAACHAGITT